MRIVFQCICLALFSVRQCRSFSASTVDTEKVPPLFPAHTDNKPNQVQVPQIFPAWSRENYLKIHQSVSKRRSFRRLVEIAMILSGQILRPLLCSLTTGPLSTKTEDDWDAFWSRKIRGKLSNAQRVAQGLPTLGPTFVKLGQALATRPDILHVPLADALANLQDNMIPFDNLTAKRIIRRDLDALIKENKKNNAATSYLLDRTERQAFLDSLSDQPVAAASFAQVYKGTLPGYGDVAVKVQRPGIRKKVESDATLFHSGATWLESLKWPRGTPMHGQPVVGSMQVVQTVDEFTARIFEDMDFRREAENMQMFSQMYCYKRGSSPTVKVVVPECIPELCSSRVIVMEWIEGTKLTDICVDCDDRQAVVAENLAIVKKAIECTLSQLLETGLLHADPHTGNLLKVRTNGETKLGYLDFGLVSSVPQRFRDGIVCAVVQVVFARNIDAVADLCVDLELLPQEKLEDPLERKKFVDALQKAFDEILLWPKDKKGRSTAVPKLRPFSEGLASLAKLIASYEFTVPPYFLNNARALATLEGIALKLDPDFNILRVIYPYSINQLMCNPSVSKKSEETFLEICRSPETRLVELNRTMMLLNDWAILTGYPKRKIFWDLATSTGGRRVCFTVIKDFFRKRFRNTRAWYLKLFRNRQAWRRKHFRIMNDHEWVGMKQEPDAKLG